MTAERSITIASSSRPHANVMFAAALRRRSRSGCNAAASSGVSSAREVGSESGGLFGILTERSLAYMSGMKAKKSTPSPETDELPDAWERFEKAFDTVMKAKPKPMRAKKTSPSRAPSGKRGGSRPA
jgi:hypothetical protein